MLSLRASGATLTAITEALNSDGVKPRRGTKWFPAAVGKILNRPALASDRA